MARRSASRSRSTRRSTAAQRAAAAQCAALTRSRSGSWSAWRWRGAARPGRAARGAARPRSVQPRLSVQHSPGVEAVVGLLGDGAAQRVQVAQHAAQHGRAACSRGSPRLCAALTRSRSGSWSAWRWRGAARPGRAARGAARPRSVQPRLSVQHSPGVEAVVGLLGDGAAQRVQVAQHAAQHGRARRAAGREEVAQRLTQSRLRQRAARSTYRAECTRQSPACTPAANSLSHNRSIPLITRHVSSQLKLGLTRINSSSILSDSNLNTRPP
ncbi:hypothetical protein ACJJTC_004845 [Scirpophaga incertulas]